MRTITIELPDELDTREADVRLLVAAHLYGEGKLSAGQAAALAGVTVRTLLESLSRYGVAIFDQTANELARDTANA